MHRIIIIGYFLFAVCLFPGKAHATESAFEHADSNKIYTFTYSTTAPPYAWLDSENKPKGLLIDFWNLWAKKQGVEVRFELTTWFNSLELVKQGKADANGGAFYTQKRRGFFIFSDPIIDVSTSLFVHNSQGIDNLDSLGDMKVGSLKGDRTTEYLTDNFPNLRIKLFNDNYALIESAKRREIDAFAKDAPIAKYLLSKYEMLGKFTEMVIYRDKFRALINKDDKAFQEIVNDGLAKISDEEKEALAHKWMLTKRGMSSKALWILVVCLTIFVFVAIILWVFMLRRQVKFRTKELDSYRLHLEDLVTERTAELDLSNEELRQEIIERKSAKAALLQSEEKYKTIFQTTGTSTVIYDEDAVITLANREFSNLTGYDQQEIEGKMTWMDFFTEQSLPKMRDYHKRRVKDLQSVPRSYETQIKSRNGRVHDGIITIELLPGTTQRVGSFLDLTELKQAEQQMYRSDKMAALGQIIAGIAHEINNPNNFIYFNVPIMKRYIEVMQPMIESHLEKDPELRILNMPYQVFIDDVHKLLDNMKHGSERITKIVAELKDYVHKGEADENKKPAAIRMVVDQVMVLVGKQVSKTVKHIDLKIEDNLPLVSMNTGKIEQMLINLIINAGHAADKKNSKIHILAKPKPGDKSKIQIEVADNGSGIPVEAIDKIFDPFFTTKGREAGTGLGLAISQKIIQDHGGSILVKSVEGDGTQFFIELPINDPENDPHPD
ncbi:MAG: transporter substrate-binding domain-containing protein [Proteobacteria bacterium]|nr:transporter substrate-binding domain-containing protein [Pseudomonadota bacterium]